jgi:hypothetical protein
MPRGTFLLDSGEGLLPRFADDLGGFLDLQSALAGAKLFDGDFHSGSWMRRAGARGGS